MSNVTITSGAGTVVSTDTVTADNSNVQNVQLVDVAAGVMTRTAMGTIIGPTNETAPGTDTAASGLNGRLQRIAQRLTTLIGLLPAALGGGGGLKVEGVGTAGTPAGGVVTVQGIGGNVPYQGGNTGNAINTATVPAVAGKTSLLRGFAVTGCGATAATTVEVTVTDGLSFTQYFEIAVPAGAAVGIVPLVVSYGEGIAASAPNTAINVSLPAFGAGNTRASVQAWGGHF